MGTDDLTTWAECDYDPAREQVRGEEQAMAEEELVREGLAAELGQPDDVEAPEQLDLRPYALMSDDAARIAGRIWLEEMRGRKFDIKSIPVVYCDLLGEEKWIEVEL